MHISCSWSRSIVALALVLSIVVLSPPAKADPPPWAPAHGWRAKHHHGDDDDDGPRYSVPSGVGQLACHRDIIGGLLGGKGGAGKGAIVGGAGGTGVVLATRGDEIHIGSGASDTTRLTSPLTVRLKL